MTKIRLLAAVAVVALCSSMAKADYFLSFIREASSPVINSQPTDTYDILVSNNGANGTGTGTNSFDVRFYAPSGMYLGVRGDHPDVNFGTAASGVDSWIQDQAGLNPVVDAPGVGGSGNSSLTQLGSASVLTLGQTPTSSAGAAPSTISSVANQLFAGISSSFIATPANPDGSPLWFARLVVPQGAAFMILNPGPGTSNNDQNNVSVNPSRQFEPGGGTFSPGDGFGYAAANNTFTNSGLVVPEPSSVALCICAAGLLSRRRTA